MYYGNTLTACGFCFTVAARTDAPKRRTAQALVPIGREPVAPEVSHSNGFARVLY